MSTVIYEESAVRGPNVGTSTSLFRLLRLHLMSRRVPSAVVVLVVCAPLMQLAVRSSLGQGDLASTTTSAKQLSLLLEAAVAGVVSAALHGPFGESERTAGRRLPWLRLTTTLLLTMVALGTVCVGVLGAGLPTSDFALVRDEAGLIGIGVLCTVIVGGHFGWAGPAVYWVIGSYAIADRWQSPWTWPARAGGDVGAELCAFAFFVVSLLAITIIGPRQYSRD